MNIYRNLCEHGTLETRINGKQRLRSMMPQEEEQILYRVHDTTETSTGELAREVPLPFWND